jgi:protein-S-isoprenylcysteine O-methyltransferase Ste14
MPLVLVAAVLLLAAGNARRVRARLGHSPITVFRSASRVERARVWFALAGLAVLAASSVWPRIATAPGFAAPRWLQALGLCVLGAAFALVLQGFGTLGTSWRIGVDLEHPAELVTRGVYGAVRHPIYAGLVWAFLGLLLLRPNLFFASYAAGAAVLCTIQARREEAFLLARHGPAYAAYLARTGRFWPRPTLGKSRMRRKSGNHNI